MLRLQLGAPCPVGAVHCPVVVADLIVSGFWSRSTEKSDLYRYGPWPAVGLNQQIINQQLKFSFLEPFNFLSELHLVTDRCSRPDEIQSMKYSDNQRNSISSLVKQDSYAVLDPKDRGARRPQVAELASSSAGGLCVSAGEWYA